MPATLPPGPRTPAVLQTIGWWTRPLAFTHRLQRRYGTRFTMRLLGQPTFVVLSDPDDVKELFQADPDVLHPGEGARLLAPIVGANSVILLDGARHLDQRKLMLPAFHGDRMQRLAGLMEELTAAELDRWPLGEPVELHPKLQRLTLEIILRAAFGLDEGPRLELLRELLPEILAFGDSPISLLPQAHRAFGGRGRFARFAQVRARADAELFALIEERRGERGERDDVLAMLLCARHGDGSPMSDEEIRDELMTALVAGHETTASSLAFAFEQLARAPQVAQRLAGGEDEYLDAVVNETMRRRPVLPNPEPRLVKREIAIGGRTYPPGVVLIASAYAIHHDPQIYERPYAFRPERWLGRRPGTYTWIPFGGGRRRCLGASFALLEMRLVLRAAAERFAIGPAGPRARPRRAIGPAGPRARPRRRMITITPGDGARVVLRRRAAGAATAAAGGRAAATAVGQRR